MERDFVGGDGDFVYVTRRVSVCVSRKWLRVGCIVTVRENVNIDNV